LPVDGILRVRGGLVLATKLIVHALTDHKAPATVIVPHYVMLGAVLSR